MQKHPKIINMSLNALKDLSKPSQYTKGERSTDNSGKPREVREEVAIQDLITFINMTVEQKNKIKKRRCKEVRLLKQGESTIKRTEKEEMIAIPMDVAETVEGILRKYLLRKMQDRQEQLRNCASKAKITHDRSGNIRAFLYRTNKENSQGNHQQEDNEAGLFRSMEAEKIDKERLTTRNEELENELIILRQKLMEKNNLISKLLSKETQLRRKYKDQFNRLVRNKNIYDISANFQRDEEEGEGRNGLNVAGKHLLEGQKNQHEQTKRCSMLKTQKSATFVKSDSDYRKDRRPKFGKTKNKIYPFRNSKKNLNQTSPATQFLKTMNKSLPTQCITKREQEASQFKENQCKEMAKTIARQKVAKDESARLPTFELHINQLQSNIASKKLSVDMSEERNLQMIAKMKDQQFEALEMHGFYKDENVKEIDKIYRN